MEKIFSVSVLKQNKSDAVNCLVIPDWIFDSILSLCNEPVEYAGQLILFENIVEYVFLSASGTIGSVFPQKKITFKESSNYSTIEFHTHTHALGDFWTDKFSTGDINSFNNRVLQEGEQYKHILFTTNNVLIWGKYVVPPIRIGFKNTDVVISNWNKWNTKYNCWTTVSPLIRQ